MFEKLTERLERSLKMLKGEHKISEINVADTLKEVRRSLIEADVNYKVAKAFVDTVKEKAIGQNVLTAIKPRELMKKIVFDELIALMGGSESALNLRKRPAVILMSGLQGSGKTTFSAKLAKKLKEEKGMRPLLVACDVYRPAAIDQLKVLGDSIEVPVFSVEGSADVVDIAKKGVAFGKQYGCDLIIIDTAGRLAIDEDMMREIVAVKNVVEPTETLFVVDAMTGQDAVNTAKAFNDMVDFDGVVLTKLDGDTRGGAAISIRAVTGKPIKFIGTGEKLDSIDVFYPDRMAGRIFGEGDIKAVADRVGKIIKEEEAKEFFDKTRKNQYNLEDYYKMIQKIKELGDMRDVVSNLPGLSKMSKNVDIPDEPFKHIEAMILSMTPLERQRPEIIKGTRVRRIAQGSGTSIQEVNRFLKQFEQTRQTMQRMSGKNPLSMMRNMRKLKGGKGF